ncbi:uncharacterized protein SCHCODRAFT_02180889 [Schizophyllum commune H4-8]|uniref:uncharacterized protein n=1 Tax=Schizophyllum commune (strain H4-8 / FGSC 9210) TaxID=578458 RepID=UPI00215E1C49|nr:uncharacterized protein SCHCODRAFT_02180889 [Schizophyllum commune H4-8]KAI5896002.1 hypothetical protein SCHCODRAFT_02180889 [Schizophyllum commune H4-8]
MADTEGSGTPANAFLSGSSLLVVDILPRTDSRRLVPFLQFYSHIQILTVCILLRAGFQSEVSQSVS